MPRLFKEESKRFSAAVPTALLERAEAQAEAERRTLSHLVTIALEEYLQAHSNGGSVTNNNSPSDLRDVGSGKEGGPVQISAGERHRDDS